MLQKQKQQQKCKLKPDLVLLIFRVSFEPGTNTSTKLTFQTASTLHACFLPAWC